MAARVGDKDIAICTSGERLGLKEKRAGPPSPNKPRVSGVPKAVETVSPSTSIVRMMWLPVSATHSVRFASSKKRPVGLRKRTEDDGPSAKSAMPWAPARGAMVQELASVGSTGVTAHSTWFELSLR